MRATLTKRVAELNSQRQGYLQQEAQKTPEYTRSFDYLVLNCSKNQAATKHMNYTVPDKAPTPAG